MAKKVTRGQRTLGEKVREPFAKQAQIVSGKRERGSSAPANFPASGIPRKKPRGKY